MPLTLRAIIGRFWSSVASMLDATFDCVTSMSGASPVTVTRLRHAGDGSSEVEREGGVDAERARLPASRPQSPARSVVDVVDARFEPGR